MNATTHTAEKEIQKRIYDAQLLQPEWQVRRVEILKRDGHKCRNCGSGEGLQVHHRQYHIFGKTGIFKKPWDYTEKHLITLCRKCHTTGHNQFNVPVFNV